MIITYQIHNSLYINVTNRCSNSCDFCIRNVKNAFEDNLWLDREPTVNEIIEDIFKRDPDKYKELVFCGFGEPLERIDDVIAVCKAVKEKSNVLLRINTNGQANLIHNKDVTPLFKSLVDVLSISLNAPNPEDYDQICHSIYGEEAFSSILDFAQKSMRYVKDVQFSVLDSLPAYQISECQKIADSLGVKLRIRNEVQDDI